MLPWPWTNAEIDTVATRLNAGTLHQMVCEKVVAGEIGFKCRGSWGHGRLHDGCCEGFGDF
jgi:hypothetical protein